MSVAGDNAMAVLPLTLDQLAAIAAGEAPSPMDAELAEALGSVLAEVAIEGVLTIRAGAAVSEGRCWLGVNGGLIAVSDVAGTRTSVTSAEGFAADLARLLDLGPRAERLPDTAVRVRRGALLDASGRSGDASVEEAARLLGSLSPDDARERAWLEALVSPRLVHWRVLVAPRGRLFDPAESRWCEVLDCGAQGMLLVWSPNCDEDADVLLVSATPTDVWRVLSSLLSAEAPSELVDGAADTFDPDRSPT